MLTINWKYSWCIWNAYPTAQNHWPDGLGTEHFKFRLPPFFVYIGQACIGKFFIWPIKI